VEDRVLADAISSSFLVAVRGTGSVSAASPPGARAPDLAPEQADSPPVGHICPRPETRIALCGAEILGVPVGDNQYVLCEECQRLNERGAAFTGHWNGDF
jgi:hypothetical protein